MNLDFHALAQSTAAMIAQLGLRLIGVACLWFAGRWLIRLASRLLNGMLGRQQLDLTIAHYARSAAVVVLNVVLVVALLSFLGFETTTFAALLAAAGVAIGAAWSGLLSNFAAGVFLVVLRSFRVGDVVSVAGVSGTVQSIGLFGTVITTPDHVTTLVGNSKILGDNILNYSVSEYRRVDLTAQLDHSADHVLAISLLQEGLARILNVLEEPAPRVEILSFTLAGPVLAVRPYCGSHYYWQVYFDTNRLILDTFEGAGLPTPGHHHVVRKADEPLLQAAQREPARAPQ